MTIALMCEFLVKIAENKNIFRHECNLIKTLIMKLGGYFIDNLDD
jgi:hypothetical protein